MEDLSKLRCRMEEIDNNILSLLKERLEIAWKIAKTKAKNSLRVYDPTRESIVLDKVRDLSGKIGLPIDYVIDIYLLIVSMTRNYQENLSVAYLGPEGTFSEIVALKRFGYDIERIIVKNISDVFREVSNGKSNIGVVPIENSYSGIVSQVLDEFVDSHLKIIGEIFLVVHQSLLSKERDISRVKKLYSHPQAISQCRIWIENNLKDVEIIETTSTSLASQIVSKERKSACIGNEILAKKHGLNILHKNVEDDPNNITRFWIIGDYSTGPTGNDKTTILCHIKDKPGALFDLIKPFKELGINMTKIESRPSRIRLWDYMFFIDFEGHIENEQVKKLMAQVDSTALLVKVLGSYPKGIILE